MNEWIDELRELSAAGGRAVTVTITGVRGSAPRDTGAKMLVSESETFGTVGGGELEYQCTRIACDLLRQGEGETQAFRRFPLGSNCGQCCGGVVDVLFEVRSAETEWFEDLVELYDAGRPALMLTQFDGEGAFEKQVFAADKIADHASEFERLRVPADTLEKSLADNSAQLVKLSNNRMRLIEPVTAGNFDIAVFGAGHVGAATVAVLSTLDCNIRWIDSRRNFLKQKMPANVQMIRSGSPDREVAAMPARTFYLIMTHSHSLDYEICSRVLNRQDFAYCGLIGSLSKQRRFVGRLRRDGVANVERLTCPIGVAGIGGKKPAEIAVSVSAEILQIRGAVELAIESQPQSQVHLVKGQ